VLATDNDAGAAAFRPFDRRRSGSLLGEGAAVVVLEERRAARARGAIVYAEVTGFGAGNDAHRPPTPDPHGRGLAVAIRRALDDGGVTAATVGYVAAHGCATRAGDLSETRALRQALGPCAAAVPVSSVKPQTGHLVGAAGALNAVVAAFAIRYGQAPATRNLDEPDPACDLNHVRREPRQIRAGHALALARGFEGQAAALLLARPS
jgi:3-oxoacyl-[acyl-carrier-protein] synthase II